MPGMEELGFFLQLGSTLLDGFQFLRRLQGQLGAGPWLELGDDEVVESFTVGNSGFKVRCIISHDRFKPWEEG